MPSNRELRHGIRNAFLHYHNEVGDYPSYRAMCDAAWFLRGEEGLTHVQQMRRFEMVHNLLMMVMVPDPDSSTLQAIHAMVHISMDMIATEAGVPVEDLIDAPDEDEEPDPFVTHAEDFEKWASDLPSADEIETDLRSEKKEDEE